VRLKHGKKKRQGVRKKENKGSLEGWTKGNFRQGVKREVSERKKKRCKREGWLEKGKEDG